MRARKETEIMRKKEAGRHREREERGRETVCVRGVYERERKRESVCGGG